MDLLTWDRKISNTANAGSTENNRGQNATNAENCLQFLHLTISERYMSFD